MGAIVTILPRSAAVRHICIPPLACDFYYVFDDCRRRRCVAACALGATRPSQRPPVANDDFDIGPQRGPRAPHARETSNIRVCASERGGWSP